MTSSRTPPACSMPFTSSSSLATLQVRCVAASSKTRPVTAGARVIPLYPGPQSFARLTHAGSPHVNKNDSVRPSWQMRRISVSTSPTTAPSKCATSSIKPPPPKADAWPHTSSSAYQPVPSPEIARLGRTLRKWKDALDAYFDTGGASNGPTEAINGIIELGRRAARGCCNPTNYGLCRLLITAGTRPLNEMSTTPA